MADSYGEPRTTLQSQAELQGLQYLEDSDRTLSGDSGETSIGPLVQKI